MVHDSVREELALKITPVIKREQPVINETPTVPPPQKASPKLQETSQIMTKATSPTLVDFQYKNATVPEWRLQLQNSVRKRLDNHKTEIAPVEAKPHRTSLVVNGATALKIEVEEQVQPERVSNPQLAKALKRIEESRQKYLVTETSNNIAEEPFQSSVKQFPQILPNRQAEYLPKQEFTNNVSNFTKPAIVPFSSEIKTEQNERKIEKFDTNKLPPLPPQARISSSFDKRVAEERKIEIEAVEEEEYAILNIPASKTSEAAAYNQSEEAEINEENEEAEDYAPLSLRFNSALFDLLICSFLSLVLLSPFMLLNGRFFSIEGFFAFLATCSIVMFIYLTTTIGFLGRTFGMRLFSLEIIDIEENAYPSLHQAAVSSSVYLLSLGLGGIGFLTMLMNSEKRAAHDLLSGTIVVKEY